MITGRRGGGRLNSQDITCPPYARRIHGLAIGRFDQRDEELSVQQFGEFVHAVRDFMEPTEQFFLKRFPTMAIAEAARPAVKPAK
jgi:hypothetical protein